MIILLCRAFLSLHTDDKEANKCRGKEIKISTDDSGVDIFVIPTNEELAIARDTLAIISK